MTTDESLIQRLVRLWKRPTFQGSFSSPQTFQKHLEEDLDLKLPMKTIHEAMDRIPEYKILLSSRNVGKLRNYEVMDNNEVCEFDLAFIPSDKNYIGFLLLIGKSNCNSYN